MITIHPIEIEGVHFTGIQVELPKTNLLMIGNEIGYIMCAALDVDLLNDYLRDRKIIAGRARGVRSVEQLLDTPLEKITDASRDYGWEVGMLGKDALLKIV